MPSVIQRNFISAEDYLQQDIFDLVTENVRNYRLSYNLALPDAIIGATAVFYQMPLFICNP
ncbi:MAG: hypothetical protein GQ532_14130 [Methylomarinum sp.]|nr:hypothetical protein [Methylomarinum sp.]